MTERTASGRALGALKAIGMEEAPLTTLEREDALFVLTAQTLVYQDGGGTRRVTLRDLTRIHSDEQGMLRVETPAGTALTASLLGFDVAGVQAFFAQVRNTTARAKEMPASPLPTPGAFKTFGTSATPPRPESGPEAAAKEVAPAPRPPAPVPPPAPLAAAEASAGQRAPTPTPLPEGGQAPKRAAPQTDAATVQTAGSERPGSEQPNSGSPSPQRPDPQSVNPQGVTPQPGGMQTSRGEGAQGEKVDAAAPGNGQAPLPPVPRPAGTVESPAARPAPPRPSPASPQSTPAPAAQPGNGQTAAAPARPVVISSSAFTPTSARAATPAPETLRAAPVPGPLADSESEGAAPTAPVTSPQMLDGLHRTLARQADVVSGLVGRLRFLGGVLFVAALLLSLVQFTADARLDALWTLLSGGVGTIALLALAELARLLALLGRSAALSAGIPGGATDAR